MFSTKFNAPRWLFPSRWWHLSSLVHTLKSKMDAKLLQSYQVKRVPPESGWGYLIAIGMALPFVRLSLFFKLISTAIDKIQNRFVLWAACRRSDWCLVIFWRISAKRRAQSHWSRAASSVRSALLVSSQTFYSKKCRCGLLVWSEQQCISLEVWWPCSCHRSNNCYFRSAFYKVFGRLCFCIDLFRLLKGKLFFRRRFWYHHSGCIFYIQCVFRWETRANDELGTITDRRRHNDLPDSRWIFNEFVRFSWCNGNISRN